MSNTQERVSVALVEDNEGTRNRLVQVIERDVTLRLKFAAQNARQMMDWIEIEAVDVLLVDLGLPDLSGVEVIRHCQRVRPETDVMVVTMFGDDESMLGAIEAGARGYLLKGKTEADLAASVHELHSGGSPMSPIIARKVLNRLPPVKKDNAPVGSKPNDDVDALTPRELEVLQLITRGYSYQELGDLLGVARSTIHSHVKSIYSKLSVHSKVEAAFEARQQGLLD